MTDEIRALLVPHLPGYEVRSITGLGEGLDNAAYEVNGELIVRASKETNPAVRHQATQREAQLLAVVAGLSTLPVPEPVFVDAETGLLGYRKLPGFPLIDHPANSRTGRPATPTADRNSEPANGSSLSPRPSRDVVMKSWLWS